MRAHDRRVHADHPIDIASSVRSGQQRRKDPVPRAVDGKLAVSFPDGLPRPEPIRQIPPGHPGPVPEDDALDHLAVITPRTTSTPHPRHQPFEPFPLRIREFTTPSHNTSIPDRTVPPRLGRRSLAEPSSRAVRWPKPSSRTPLTSIPARRIHPSTGQGVVPVQSDKTVSDQVDILIRMWCLSLGVLRMISAT